MGFSPRFYNGSPTRTRRETIDRKLDPSQRPHVPLPNFIAAKRLSSASCPLSISSLLIFSKITYAIFFKFSKLI